jgi:hypothetical protein
MGYREIGKWKLENGNWKMEIGKWKLENGNWRCRNGNVVEIKLKYIVNSSHTGS